MGYADIGKAADALARSAALGRLQDLNHRLQFVEDQQYEPAAAPEESLQRAPLGRLEQLGEMAVSCEESAKGNAEDGVGRVGRAADCPRGPPLGREPAAMPFDRAIGRNVDPGL